MRHRPISRIIARLDAHHRLAIAGTIALGVFLIARDRLQTPASVVITWDAYALATLAMAWTSIVLEHPRELRRNTSLQDSGRTAIFVLLLLAAVASIFSVVLLLGPARNSSDGWAPLHIVLGFLAVACSWTLVHTIFTLHYAHRFYGPGDAGTETKHAGGLDFPETEEPDYLDFAYFSFVIGMTSQVSDVQITSRPMRRLGLLHGVISFGFNTMVLALGINVLSGLL